MGSADPLTRITSAHREPLFCTDCIRQDATIPEHTSETHLREIHVDIYHSRLGPIPKGYVVPHKVRQVMCRTARVEDIPPGRSRKIDVHRHRCTQRPCKRRLCRKSGCLTCCRIGCLDDWLLSRWGFCEKPGNCNSLRVCLG